MKNLYVGNMEATTTEQDLRTAFAVYGPVDVVSIITDRTTGLPREKDANEAVLALNGSLMAGRAIVVGEARAKTGNPRTQTSP